MSVLIFRTEILLPLHALLTLSAHAQRVTVVVESVSLSVCNAKLTEAAAAFLHLKQVST